jgi:hypothetical protein
MDPQMSSLAFYQVPPVTCTADSSELAGGTLGAASLNSK